MVARALCPKHDHDKRRCRCIGPGCRVFDKRPTHSYLGCYDPRLPLRSSLVTESEGVTLRLSSVALSGYKGVEFVRNTDMPYHAHAPLPERRLLGKFDDPVEAARCVSKYMDDLEALQAPRETVTEAPLRRLHFSARSGTGYRGVSRNLQQSNQYDVKATDDKGNDVYLGSYATALEGAIAYAEYKADPKGFLDARQREAAEKLKGVARSANGLTLHRSAKSRSGYKGVIFRPLASRNQWQVQICTSSSSRVSLGCFRTAKLGAIAYAEWKAKPTKSARIRKLEGAVKKKKKGCSSAWLVRL